MLPNKHKVPVGTLLRTKRDMVSRSAITFESVLIKSPQIGLIVANNVWPDDTWTNRDYFQLSAPFYKVLFGRVIVLVSDVYLAPGSWTTSECFEILDKT